MSLKIQWPENGWPERINEAVRTSLEQAIRSAMNNDTTSSTNNKKSNNNSSSKNNNSASSNNNNNNKSQNDKQQQKHQEEEDDEQEYEDQEQPLSSLMRGVVNIDGLNLGKVAPQIVLKKITDVSPGRSGFLARVAYKGDAWISMRGIEINLDPTRVFVSGGSGLQGGRTAEVVAPLFCPLTLKLSDLDLSGDVKIEISHEEEAPDVSSSTTSTSSNGEQSERKKLVPDTFTEMFSSPSSQQQQQSKQKKTTTSTISSSSSDNRQFKRKLFIQLMSEEDFINDFNVDSNFGAVPQAVEKIKGTIRAAVRPLFQGLRSKGMTVQL